MLKKPGVFPWFVVFLVGVIVVVLVVALGLFGRLNSAQKVLDAGKPALQSASVTGSRGGITMVSSIADTYDPIMRKSGGGAADLPKLIAFASKRTGMPKSKVIGLLKARFPHTYAILTAIPLQSVNRELPKLVTFLAGALKTSPPKVLAALKTNFPRLTQSITQLPIVVKGWDNVPGTAGLTRFDGTPVKTVPQVRDYFSKDVIPVLERQGENFRDLAGTGGVKWIPLVLIVLGAVVMIFSAIMMALASQGPLPAGTKTFASGVVILAGVIVVGLVLVLNLFPRLYGGNDVLKEFKPAFDAQRVAGARGGVDMVDHIAKLSDPLVRPSGGAAAEVPKLVAFVSGGTGLSKHDVLITLKKKFPHVYGLLNALPLTSVSKELPGVVSLLGPGVVTAVPHLSQTVLALPQVTSGWNKVPGTRDLTRFDGRPVKTAPQVVTYFSKDVVPILENQQAHFEDAESPFPPLTVFPPLLLVVGLLVIGYGVVLLRAPRAGT